MRMYQLERVLGDPDQPQGRHYEGLPGARPQAYINGVTQRAQLA